MKRKEQILTNGIKTHIDNDLSKEQLEGIGRVVIAYNENEVVVHAIFDHVLGLTHQVSPHVSSRINGLEGVTGIIKHGLIDLAFEADVKAEICQTLDQFMELKTYRDAVVHARIFHAPSGIAKAQVKRGVRYEVLIASEALWALYERFSLLHDELCSLMNAVVHINYDRTLRLVVPQLPKLSGEEIADRAIPFVAKYRADRRSRMSHRALPTFPDLPPEEQGPDLLRLYREAIDSLVAKVQAEES